MIYPVLREEIVVLAALAVGLRPRPMLEVHESSGLEDGIRHKGSVAIRVQDDHGELVAGGHA